MNSLEIKLHPFQKELLKKLATTQNARFNELLIEDLESEHMNYHLQRLIELKFVEKEGNLYQLTDAGKDYSNLMDDDVEFIEKQPKTSVILNVMRKNRSGEIEYLFCKRLRQPYYGKVGRITGKVRFGETLEEAARRELYEETGLEASSLHLTEIYHKLRDREDGSAVQDVIFYIFMVKISGGSLIEKTPYQENFWITKKALEKDSKLDPFDDLVMDDRFEPKKLEFTESCAIAEGY